MACSTFEISASRSTLSGFEAAKANERHSPSAMNVEAAMQ